MSSLWIRKYQGGKMFIAAAAAAAKSLQSYLTLCDPIDGSPPGSPVPGILQARTLEWVAISFSNTWKWKVKVKSLSCVRLLATPWTSAYQAPPTVGFSRQEYWSEVPLPSPWLGAAQFQSRPPIPTWPSSLCVSVTHLFLLLFPPLPFHFLLLFSGLIFWFRTCPNPEWPHLKILTSAKTLFQISYILRFIFLWGHNSDLYRVPLT